MSDERARLVVVVGGGETVEVFGPFDDEREAEAWATANAQREWTVRPLNLPGRWTQYAP